MVLEPTRMMAISVFKMSGNTYLKCTVSSHKMNPQTLNVSGGRK
jgi:hypothetical protein